MSNEAYADRPLVYLAGPYTHPDPVHNVHSVVGIAGAICDEGSVTPVVPHLTALWHFIDPRPIEFWYEYDLALLARCDALLRLPGKSTGADKEVTYASARMPIFEVEASASLHSPASVLQSQGFAQLLAWAAVPKD